MQLKITNLASVSRKIETNTSNNFKENIKTPVSSNNIKDICKMIVMSGTAKRKSFKKTQTPQEPVKIYKKQHRENFLKLRTPFYKSRQKQIQPEEKLMNKTCEMLFEYLKPYKDIQMMKGKNDHKREWNRTIGSILKTTNVVYQKTATRKVEILSIFEENSNYGFKKDTSILNLLPQENNFMFEYNRNNSGGTNNLVPERVSQAKDNFSVLRKTVSSEDFVTNAFSEPRIAFL